MTHQLVPDHVLQAADKVLFIIQGSVSQFIYLHNYFVAFKKEYSHIKADLWVDEKERTRCFWKWEKLKNYGLYDWLDSCSFFNKVYTKTYSVSLFKQSVQQARQENYSLIIVLTLDQLALYTRVARSISPQGFIAGVARPTSWYQLASRRGLKKFDVVLDVTKYHDKGHIFFQYAAWFEELFGLTVDQREQVPSIFIPRQWISFAKLRFMKWGFDKKTKQFGKVIFIIPFAQDAKKNLSLERVLEIMRAIKRSDQGADVSFIINVDRAHYYQARKFFNYYSVNNVILFCAKNNFFQVPALIAQCDLVISVESSVMHLAGALSVPLIALIEHGDHNFLPLNSHNLQIFLLKNFSIDIVLQVLQNFIIFPKRTTQEAS